MFCIALHCILNNELYVKWIEQNRLRKSYFYFYFTQSPTFSPAPSYAILFIQFDILTVRTVNKRSLQLLNYWVCKHFAESAQISIRLIMFEIQLYNMHTLHVMSVSFLIAQLTCWSYHQTQTDRHLTMAANTALEIAIMRNML